MRQETKGPTCMVGKKRRKPTQKERLAENKLKGIEQLYKRIVRGREDAESNQKRVEKAIILGRQGKAEAEVGATAAMHVGP